MRKILFKGKRVDDGEWIMGNLVLSYTLSTQFSEIGPHIRFLNSENFFEQYEVIEETICQHTGIDDFWEGDVYEPWKPSIGFFEIKYENASFVVYNKYGYWGTLTRLIELSLEFNEILIKRGNVHDIIKETII